MLRITDTIALADWELSESFTRSQGPGGQNVNKVETAVELRFEAERSPHLAPPVKARLKRLAGRRWTLDGAIVIRAEETRSQTRNRELARERLVEMIRAALVAPKRRIATKPTLGSQRRRVAAKVQRGQVKALRAAPGGEDE
jgi:ribosome-associated protein